LLVNVFSTVLRNVTECLDTGVVEQRVFVLQLYLWHESAGKRRRKFIKSRKVYFENVYRKCHKIVTAGTKFRQQ